MTQAILSIVRVLEDPLKIQYIASGGNGYTEDMQKAQVFGFAKRAQENLNRYYRNRPNTYEVIPVLISPEFKS